jgi:Outer membrane lipoprotein-sorting protein
MKHPMLFVLACSLGISLFFSASAQSTSGKSVTEILKATDLVRGGGMAGVQWDLQITAADADTGANIRKLRVRASGENSLAETMFPARAAGGKLLQLGRNRWYGRPDIQKAISISSRQKLAGPAANGDIASTNYSKDYEAKLLRMDSFQGESVYVLSLEAKSRFVTYDKIVYWVSEKRLVPVKAEFLTVSGKLFKTAVFETNNTIDMKGKKSPFISRMTIRDSYDNNNISTLEYSNVRVAKFPLDMFSVAGLTR